MSTSEGRDAGHIWHRQSVERPLGDRRHVLEVTVPIPIGASPEERARLYDEAIAGMEQLAERLVSQAASVPATASASSAAHKMAPAAYPASGIAESPAKVTSSAPSARPPGRTTTTPVAAGSAPSASGALSRAEFLQQAGGMGLTPRHVMDRLGVRTLEGLNYAEALEQIKRQLLRESAQSAGESDSLATAPGAPVAPIAAQLEDSYQAPSAASAPASAPARYFDEEDDYDYTFELPDGNDDAPAALGPGSYNGAPTTAPAVTTGQSAVDEPDELDLDDVPDFGTLPAVARSASAPVPRPAPVAEPPSRSANAASGAPLPNRPAIPVSHQALAQRARAHDLLARLRTIRGGGQATGEQLKPFTNVVVGQLGVSQVATLTEQVWGIATEQLSSDQMSALVKWGKTDPFAAEVVSVLELLGEEQAAKDHDSDETAEAKRPATRGGRATTRSAGSGAGSTR